MIVDDHNGDRGRRGRNHDRWDRPHHATPVKWVATDDPVPTGRVVFNGLPIKEPGGSHTAAVNRPAARHSEAPTPTTAVRLLFTSTPTPPLDDH